MREKQVLEKLGLKLRIILVLILRSKHRAIAGRLEIVLKWRVIIGTVHRLVSGWQNGGGLDAQGMKKVRHVLDIAKIFWLEYTKGEDP